MTKLSIALAASLLLLSGAASAQDYPKAQDAPQTKAPTPGIPGSDAVNPAPDAQGQPYLGVGEQSFYDPMERERAIQQRLAVAAASGALNPRQAHDVQLALAKVVAEDRTQTARHGGLRDWDRERLNDMMNHIVEHYAQLRG